MKTVSDIIKEKPYISWLLFSGTLIIVFLLGLLTASVMERRTEALFVYKPTTDIQPYEPRDSIWGRYFPREYDSYLRTKETNFRSKYNGNSEIDMLKEDPKLVILWAGYSFSKDYYQARGHSYAITDIRNTLRTGAPKEANDGPQPNTCWTCKSPDVPRLMSKIGPGEFYEGKWASRGAEMINPVGCADCHDPATMNLRISRPALSEAFSRQGKDIKKSTQQEMRSLVCAQCHVEYYFKGDNKYLTFPWDKGINVEDIENYYDSYQFTDWTHGISKTPMLKAQHPDWELSQLGIHAQRGVSCSDCHLPYRSEGAVKYTDHHIQSPLNNINASCQVCHRDSEAELVKNVNDRQDKNFQLRQKTEEVIIKAHFEAKQAWEVGATTEEMNPILTLIRHAQWRWDFATAGHGSSFHAPLEVARILGTAIDKAQEARVQLRMTLDKHGFSKEVQYPDISTKEKAQVLIGIDKSKLDEEKRNFLDTMIPSWDEIAKQRENSRKQ